MKVKLKRIVIVLLLVLSVTVLSACGGGDGDRVTGDSPEGVPIDSSLEDEVESGEGLDTLGADGELPADESLTDGN